MKERVLLIFIFLLFRSTGGIAQSFYFTHYQVDDGLSNNAVLCMMQDKLGFMWFGTRDGLNRFDGLSYKVFGNGPLDPNTIGSNAIMCLSEDTYKNIWVGTEKGLYVFDQLTEKFTQFPKAGNGAIQALKVVDNKVYYITLYVLYCFDIRTKALKTYTFPNEVTAFSLFKDGALWITSTAGQVARYNPATDRFDNLYNVFTKSRNTVSQRIQSICEAGAGKILVGTSNEGLKLLDTKNGDYKDLLTYNVDRTDINVMDILNTGTDEYWIATQSGIYIMDLKSNQYSYISKQYEDPYSLSNNIVQSLFEDRQGGIWVSTYFGGVNYFSTRQMIFKKYFPKKSEPSISGYAVGEMKSDKNGKLWIATEDAGLNRFDPATGRFINFNPAVKKGSITYSNVQCLLVSEDSVWAGTFLHGLDLLNLKGEKIRNYNTLNSSIGSNFSDALLKTSTGVIMAGTDKGVYTFNRSGNTFEPVRALPQTFFRALGEDSSGNIWAGTYGNGVYQYNLNTNQTQHYLLSPGTNKSVASNTINYIFCGADHTVWFATEGGLGKLNSRTGALTIYTTQQNLPANVIYAIVEDDKKDLWLSTSRGLARFTPSTNQVRVFSKSDGLLTDQFNYRSACKDQNGNIYFGSIKGMISFHPDSIRETRLPAPVYITGFQVYNKELPINAQSPLRQSILFTSGITLPYNQSSFSIDFAALDYSSPLTIKYAYKMEGLDKTWNVLSTNRKAYFTELSPGKYTFIVKNISDTGQQPAHYARLTIEILPPLWLTWEAYLAYIAGTLSLTYFLIMFFINRSKERHKRRLEKMAFEKEKEHYEDKIDFFTNVAHEIKTPLTLIKGPMENIMDAIGTSSPIQRNLDLMNRNTDRLMHLANQILDFRKIELNGFHLNFAQINISELLRGIYQRFKPIADSNHLHFALAADEEIYACADEEALIKIFGNLIDNAIKYAATSVMTTLEYSNHNNSYRMMVTNDGFVIPEGDREKIFESFYRVKDTAAQSGTGIGLTLSRTLAEMHSGTLVLDTGAKEQNVFILELPVNPNNGN
ncbi:histidine kinase [Niabella sp. CC-SYL272]|uniref:ligand-binding sensor domain-containing protein n=1 Tax=Niabella agricola TaxID=2891571 RepID=UPI001F24AA9A|nr:sensor histidine kinase [Niabella agricola]MCF3108123.1 histidine kinase [Niabella agricola]